MVETLRVIGRKEETDRMGGREGRAKEEARRKI